jgi:hypothetical protein
MTSNSKRGLGVTLWIVAVLLMFSSAIYQKMTGPTEKLRGSFEESGQVYKYRLLRSEVTTTDARIALPDPGSCDKGQLWYKRYTTSDSFIPLPLQAEEEEVRGEPKSRSAKRVGSIGRGIQAERDGEGRSISRRHEEGDGKQSTTCAWPSSRKHWRHFTSATA